jgi:hypothetical protein
MSQSISSHSQLRPTPMWRRCPMNHPSPQRWALRRPRLTKRRLPRRHLACRAPRWRGYLKRGGDPNPILGLHLLSLCRFLRRCLQRSSIVGLDAAVASFAAASGSGPLRLLLWPPPRPPSNPSPCFLVEGLPPVGKP